MTVENQNEVYDLTPTQQAMLLYSLYAPESRAYFEQACYAYQGLLDRRAFAKAWQQVVDRHEILRTGFSDADSEHLSQIIFPEATLPFEYHDWRGLSSAQQQTRLEQFLADDVARGFDISNPPLLRVTVLQTADKSHWIVVTNHHIILDGWSMSVLRDEVSQLYKQHAYNIDSNLQAPHQFGEYLEWRDKQTFAKAESFWRQELEGLSVANHLPIDKAAGKLSGPNEHFDERQISLPASLTNEIRSCARRSHVTLSTWLQVAWALLLGQYCAADDVVFGITASGRPYELAGIESLVGLLINTLPVRVKIGADESCLACLKKVQNKIADVLEHEQSSLTQIQEWGKTTPGLPLFETLVVFENFAGSGSSFDLEGPIQLASAHLSRTNYPLTLVVDPGAELRLQLVYHRGRFASDAIERMLVHLGTILESMVADIEQPVANLQIMTAAETETVLVDWNNTHAEFPDGLASNRLFERQVERTPEAIAVQHENRSVTYAELNSRANQLAHYLKEVGVERENLVGICIERSIEMLVSVLATLKAGGAYVPLDPTYPANRLNFMLNDSGVKVLLTREGLLQVPLEYSGAIVRIDEEAALINACSADNLNETASASDLAYIIYTSGSTGKPKGTMIEHRSLVNFTCAAAAEYAISPADRVLQFASLSFDTSLEEIFPALTTGATVVLRTDAMLSSARDFLRTCGEFGVTVLDLPTAYWHELTDELRTDNLELPESLRLVILGGEKALPERLASWREYARDSVRLVNTYGPTETTIVATACDLSVKGESSEPADEVHIGRPLRNTIVYILDRQLRPVPVGVPGELYIGGAGIARGYLNRPDLTAQKFISNPFADARAPRLYKTGDVVRYRADGNIEFLHRMDNQVKIRGFRVELEEIEQAIRSHASVTDAIMLVQDAEGDKRLVAYVVAPETQQPTTTELREFLTTKLPVYMLPSGFVMIDAFPLLPNGKIDRQSLPLLEQERPVLAAFEAPRSLLEESVAKVWCELLKLERIGVNDNFFELGGHSLVGAKMISSLRRKLNVELNLVDVFQSPTIARLSEVIYQRQIDAEGEEELASLLAELTNLSDEEAQQRLAAEVGKGGTLAQALRVAIATGTVAAIEILSYTI